MYTKNRLLQLYCASIALQEVSIIFAHHNPFIFSPDFHTFFKGQIDCSVAFPRSITRYSLVGSHVPSVDISDLQPAQVVQLGVQFHGVFMSVRLHDLLFIVIPSNVRSGFPDQPAFENDFVGFLFRLPDDWPFCKGGLNATLGNGSLFAYWNRKTVKN